MAIGQYVKPLRYEARFNEAMNRGEQFLVEIKRLNPENFGEYIYNVDVHSMQVVDVNFNLNYSYLAINATVYMRMPQKILIDERHVAKEFGVAKNEVVTGTIDTSVNLNFVVALDIPARGSNKQKGDTYDFTGIFAYVTAAPLSRGWDGKFIYEDKEFPIEMLVDTLHAYQGPDYTRGHASLGYIDPGSFFTLDFKATFEGYIRHN